MQRAYAQALLVDRAALVQQGFVLEEQNAWVVATIVAHLEEIENWLRKRGDIDVIFQSYSRMVTEPRQGAGIRVV